MKYTKCLIGGLPSEDYFAYTAQGMSKSELQRKMLIALAELEAQQEEELAKEGENERERVS